MKQTHGKSQAPGATPANQPANMASQIGQFFLYIGLIVLLIFFGTYQAGEPQYNFCLSGLGLFGLGVLLFFRFREPPAPAERFRTWKKYQQKKVNKTRK